MPLLSQLREITAPVEIRRGSLVFTLHVALEKFTPEEGEYGRLRLEMVQIAHKKNVLRHDNQRLMVAVQEASDLQSIRFDLIEQNGLADERTRIAADDSLDEDAKLEALDQAEEDASAKVSDEMVNKEFERRLDEADKAADANQKQIGEADSAEHRNIAARLAYLVASSDIEDPEGSACLSGKVEKTSEELEADSDFFFKNFSVALLLHCLQKVEETVYGPLGTASSSAV